ncbi:MAG: hypothetical protein B9S32_07185 [Verrucomicrobia bacterium Tous-C9LFEB]|nr:MAG: hypothetical protein B9S32_07185 [Verrucomicrobia bacterium Tous-C9LFEB]
MKLQSPRLSSLSSLVAALACSLAFTAHADFSTGFETTSGAYTAGSPIAGVDDNGLAGTNAWSFFGSGSSSNVTITNVGAISGAQSLALANVGSSVGATVNLTGAVDYTQKFTVSFSFTALNALGAAPFFFQLGSNSYGNTQPNWLRGYIGAGTSSSLYIFQDATTGGAVNPGTKISYDGSAAGTYASLANSQSYTLSLTIDPTNHVYTDATLNGTSILNSLLAVSNGEIPYIGGSLANATYLFLVSGSSSTGSNILIDNFSIANVPEPASMALVLMSGFAWAAFLRRRTTRAL